MNRFDETSAFAANASPGLQKLTLMGYHNIDGYQSLLLLLELNAQ